MEWLAIGDLYHIMKGTNDLRQDIIPSKHNTYSLAHSLCSVLLQPMYTTKTRWIASLSEGSVYGSMCDGSTGKYSMYGLYCVHGL